MTEIEIEREDGETEVEVPGECDVTVTDGEVRISLGEDAEVDDGSVEDDGDESDNGFTKDDTEFEVRATDHRTEYTVNYRTRHVVTVEVTAQSVWDCNVDGTVSEHHEVHQVAFTEKPTEGGVWRVATKRPRSRFSEAVLRRAESRFKRVARREIDDFRQVVRRDLFY